MLQEEGGGPLGREEHDGRTRRGHTTQSAVIHVSRQKCRERLRVGDDDSGGGGDNGIGVGGVSKIGRSPQRDSSNNGSEG